MRTFPTLQSPFHIAIGTNFVTALPYNPPPIPPTNPRPPLSISSTPLADQPFSGRGLLRLPRRIPARFLHREPEPASAGRAPVSSHCAEQPAQQVRAHEHGPGRQ